MFPGNRDGPAPVCNWKREKKGGGNKTTNKLQPERRKLRAYNFGILPCLSVYLD